MVKYNIHVTTLSCNDMNMIIDALRQRVDDIKMSPLENEVINTGKYGSLVLNSKAYLNLLEEFEVTREARLHNPSAHLMFEVK